MNPINVTGYDRDERAAWAAEESMKITFEQLVEALDKSGTLMLDTVGVYKQGGVFAAMREDVDLTDNLRRAVDILNSSTAPEGTAK